MGHLVNFEIIVLLDIINLNVSVQRKCFHFRLKNWHFCAMQFTGVPSARLTGTTTYIFSG